MDRRLFVGQFAAALVLYGKPAPLSACLSPVKSTAIATPIAQNKAIRWIQNGQLGSPQRLVISHRYSPGHTPLTALWDRVRQDMEQASRLLGVKLPTDLELIGAGSPSAAFGSYSTQFESGNMTVVWQGLARVGVTATPITGSLQLYGSKGMLQTAPDGESYQFVDFEGQTAQAERSYTANQVTRRHFLRGEPA